MATVRPGFPFDPFDPPPEVIKTAAELLARELADRGVEPSVYDRPGQPGRRAYVVVVPGGYTELVVEVAGCFYSWDDPAAERGGRSHAVWGDHADAATRILATVRGMS